MRSVKVERKPGRSRISKSGRNAPRASRAAPAPQKVFGKRKPLSNNIARARLREPPRRWLAFRRPMLTADARALSLPRSSRRCSSAATSDAQ